MCCDNRCDNCRLINDDWDPYGDDDSYDDYDRPEYDSERVVQYHGYRPDPLVFRGDGPLYLGMELEVHTDKRTWNGIQAVARRAQKALGDVVYLQEDGSCSNGFEITTHPMSYEWAIEHFPWDALPALAADGCWTNANVGLHVHVSRAAFTSECHLYRWMKFVHRNAEQVMALARRRNSSWAPFEIRHRAGIKHYMKGPARADRYYVDWDRYQAINPGNRDTLEVRVFASSLDPREVQAALAFCAASVEYTRDLDASKIIKERGWAWQSFVTWLRSRPQYRVLLEVLEGLQCVS
jgi:hypothetical protein